MLNVCVVGLGWWGKLIVEMLSESTKVRVKAANDLSNQRSLCDELGVRFIDTYEEVLKDREIDAVILTTPNSMHVEQIISAANAGKHVFCEKPLSLELESAFLAVDACIRNNVRLGIGHERRFEPPIQELKQVINSGGLGKLLQIEGNFSQNKFLSLSPDNWRLSAKEAGCGPMTATGIHLLDLACDIAGPAEQVFAKCDNTATSFESGDSVSANIVFKNGVFASINAMLSTPFYSRFAVFGSQGWFEIRDKTHVENPTGWIVTRSSFDGTITTRDYPRAYPVRANIEAFADSVLENQETYPIGLQSMLDTVSLLETVDKSVKSGQLHTPKRKVIGETMMIE